MSVPAITDTRLNPELDRWQPKTWKPEYERIVGLSCSGMSNKMIASETGYTPEHVSNILNLDYAEELRSAILAKMRDVNLKTIPDKLENVTNKAIERVQAVIEDDELFYNNPFQVVDRSLRLLEGAGHLKKNVPAGTNIERAIIINGETASNLFEGLAKADQARKLNAAVDVTE